MLKQVLFVVMLCLSICYCAHAQAGESDELTWRVQFDIAFVSDPTELVGIKQDDTVDYLQPSIDLALFYKGFFIQSDRNGTGSRNRNAEIGYRFYESTNYELSVLAKGYLAGFDENDIYSGILDEEVVPELAGIDSRLSTTMAGFRYLYFSDDSIFSIDLANGIDKEAHTGWLIDTYYLHTFRHRNWDINAGLGATYLSEETNSYFYGVNEHESRPFRPIYSPNSGAIYTLELSAQRPISPSWIFNIGINVNHYSNSIFDSPLVARDTVVRFKVSVGYVL